MESEHFILISLEDSKSKLIADVLSNKTCKKLIFHLSEIAQASEKDLAESLKIPINTVEYNLKKLVEAGFVQKKKDFFWSKKGKKILMYELTNKSIILSPKKANSRKIKSIIPAFLLTLAGTVSVWVYEKIKLLPKTSQIIPSQSADILTKEFLAEDSSLIAAGANSIFSTSQSSPSLWPYFLAGALIAIFVITIINWRKL